MATVTPYNSATTGGSFVSVPIDFAMPNVIVMSQRVMCAQSVPRPTDGPIASGTISGVLTNALGPLAFARVMLLQDGNTIDDRVLYTTTDAAGSYSFTGLPAGDYVVLPFDPTGAYRSKVIHTVVLPAPPIVAGALLTGVSGYAYSSVLTGSVSGVWSLGVGAPSWASINAASGIISGLPTTTGTYSFDVILTDTYGRATASTQSLRIVSDLQSIVLSDSPWAYWKLDEDASATAVADASGNGRNITTIGVSAANRQRPPLSADGFGTSMLYGSAVSSGNIAALGGDIGLSYAAMVKLTSRGTDGFVLHNGNTNISAQQGAMLGVTSAGAIYMQTFVAATWYSPSTSAGVLAVGETALIGFAHDPVANTITFYKNGIAIATVAHTVGLSAGNALWTIGATNGVLNSPINGYIDHVMVFNGVLPASRWLAHAQATGLA